MSEQTTLPGPDGTPPSTLLEATDSTAATATTTSTVSSGKTAAAAVAVASDNTPRGPFPTHGLLPRTDTQAGEFVRKNASYDGRGTVVAVLDTGIDPGAQGLQTTSDGKRKVVDFVDCTGSGDVELGEPQRCASGALELRGASGRMLRLNAGWTNPTGEWRVGAKRLYDIAPSSVRGAAKREREERFHKEAQRLADGVGAQRGKENKPSKEVKENKEDKEKGKDGDKESKTTELDAQAAALALLGTAYEDSGAMLDCVVFHDGTQWRAAVDTEATGDLTHAHAMGAYKITGDVALLSRRQLLYFTLNFYDDGHILSIVVSAGPHATHVSGILAANHVDEPQNNGVAPGAQLVSLLIGDHRVGSLETGVALTRAAAAIVEHGADLANMSFGEPSATHNAGQWVQTLRAEVVRRHRCVFVASAGNEGPALTTVGTPGGTTAGVIGVGAFVGDEQMRTDHAMYESVHDTSFTWSSRGPTADGARGCDVFAPGSAIASYPAYTQQRLRLANGTSMSSPNLCGCLALLVSAWKQQNGNDSTRISPYRVSNALLATARPFGDELGAGLVQTDDAWQFLMRHRQRVYEDVDYAVSVLDMGGARGVYLRNAEDSAQPRHLKVSVSPIFVDDADDALEFDTDGHRGQAANQRRFDFEQRVLLTADAPWVRVPGALYLGSEGSVFSAMVDATKLEPGHLHVATIRGFDSAAIERGPVFTVPVTVTKPLPVGPSAYVRLGTLSFHPTDVVRRFIAVPAGATRARIVLRTPNTEAHAAAPALFYLHCLQLAPQERFNAYELKERVSVGHPSFVAGAGSAEQRYQRFMDVLGGATLEVCVAQFWNQLDCHEVDVTVDFHGITPAGSQSARSFNGASGLGAAIAINGNYGVVRTDFYAAVRPEYGIRPKASLGVLRMALRPLSATVSPCASERDIHLASGVAIHRLVLDYALEIKSDGATIRPRLPALDTKIYESWADDFALAIFDANKRRVASQISYTANVTLRKRGNYLVRVQIRHRNEKDLEALKASPLLVDMQLSTKINVPTFLTLASAFTSTVVGSRLTVSSIARGATMPLFFRTELTGLPAEASPGDVLCGSLSLSSQTAELPIEYVVPAKARSAEKPEAGNNGAAVSEASLTPAEKDRKALDEAIRNLRIGWIKKAKDDGVREQLVSELLASDVLRGSAPGGDDGKEQDEQSKDADNDFRAAVLSAQLDALDPMRKTHLPWSDGAKLTAEAARSAVGVADHIVELAYPLALTVRLHQNQNHQPAGVSDADRRRKKLAEAARDRLVGALTTKCRALAFLTTQTTASSRSSETSVDFIDVVSSSEDGEKSGSHWLSEYEKTVSDLTKWTGEKQQDEDAQFLMATLPLLIAKQSHGRALLSALKWIDKAPLLESNAAERKAMVEMRDLLVSQLGWTVWADYLRDLALVERPPSYETL